MVIGAGAVGAAWVVGPWGPVWAFMKAAAEAGEMAGRRAPVPFSLGPAWHITLLYARSSWSGPEKKIAFMF